MRGAVAPSVISTVRVGTIPAGAGSRDRGAFEQHAARDHPRGCGEQVFLITCGTVFAGPSPRVRGAEPDTDDHGEYGRTIPAGAGSRHLHAVRVPR
ncbi:conserved hypothetical protein [Streptomyces sp. F-3]|nr:conserved hypothetical protein [Streptomyces sp. F-3]